MEAAEGVAELVKEVEVQWQVKRAAEALGFACYDTSQGYRPGGRRHGTTRVTKGFPDLVLIHRSRPLILFVEVKGERTRVTSEQVVFQERVKRAGGHAAICRSVEEFRDFVTPLGFEFEVGPRLTLVGGCAR